MWEWSTQQAFHKDKAPFIWNCFNIFLQKCGRTFGLNVNCSYICEAYSFPSKGRDILVSLLQCPRVVVATCENRRVRCNSSGNSSSSLLKANLTDFLRGTVIKHLSLSINLHIVSPHQPASHCWWQDQEVVVNNVSGQFHACWRSTRIFKQQLKYKVLNGWAQKSVEGESFTWNWFSRISQTPARSRSPSVKVPVWQQRF